MLPNAYKKKGKLQFQQKKLKSSKELKLLRDMLFEDPNADTKRSKQTLLLDGQRAKPATESSKMVLKKTRGIIFEEAL